MVCTSRAHSDSLERPVWSYFNSSQDKVNSYWLAHRYKKLLLSHSLTLMHTQWAGVRLWNHLKRVPIFYLQHWIISCQYRKYKLIHLAPPLWYMTKDLAILLNSYSKVAINTCIVDFMLNQQLCVYRWNLSESHLFTLEHRRDMIASTIHTYANLTNQN